MAESVYVRQHAPELFSRSALSARGICAIHNYRRGPCEPPVVDVHFERRPNGTANRGRDLWKALCRFHANQAGVTDEQIAAAPVSGRLILDSHGQYVLPIVAVRGWLEVADHYRAGPPVADELVALRDLADAVRAFLGSTRA